MMIAMMVAGIGSVLAGLLVILYGIPIREFGFGNTLILIGVLAVCTGMLMLALSAVVAELRVIARRLTDPRIETLPRPTLPEPPQTQPAESLAAVAPLATQDETAPAAPAARPKRNLMFESSMRKDRERPTGEPPAGSFEDAWPRVDRGRSNGDAPPQRRGARAPLSAPEANVAASSERSPPAPSPPSEAQPGVTVLKSGVVDGMAYSLYSDGSIEAQMPEGLMRFASLDELTAHIDRRP